MKMFLLIPTMLIFSSGIFAQGIYNNGGKIVIGPGAYMYISGTGGNFRNETNVTDGAIALNGTLKLDGNYTNNVAASDILATIGAAGQVALTGTVMQTLGGTTTAPFIFNNMTINNGSGALFTKTATVNGILTLTNGLANIGNNDFIFGPVSSVGGVPSATAMIIGTGTGQVKKQFTSAGSFTFPVGDNNVTAKYSPATLNFISGTFAAGAYAGINLVNARYPGDTTTQGYLNRYWNVTQSGITAFSCNAAFNYLTADVVGTENKMYAVRINPLPATTFDPANTTLHQLTATGLTSFGTFTGTIAYTPLTLTVYLQGLYAGGGLMTTAFNFDGINFTPKWGPTIADHITVEIHDPVTYSTVKKVFTDVPLNVNGTVATNIPSLQNGNYYITIKHRNSIETVCATPQTFNGGAITYNFSDAATKAFGSNLKSMGGGIYAIYTGDITDLAHTYPTTPVQDGIIDILDLYYVYPSYLGGGLGYVPSDLNGDGVVDVLDLYLNYNNYLLGIYAMTP
jgi:hypothetical protein